MSGYLEDVDGRDLSRPEEDEFIGPPQRLSLRDHPGVQAAFARMMQGLDPDQAREVNRPFDGVLAVTANAGSGKTSTMIARLLRYVFEGYDPRSLIAISYTNKASNEIRTRYNRFFDPHLEQGAMRGRPRPFLGTLHAFSFYVLTRIFELSPSALTDAQNKRLLRDLPAVQALEEKPDLDLVIAAINNLYAEAELHYIAWPEFAANGMLRRVHNMTDAAPKDADHISLSPEFSQQYRLLDWFAGGVARRRIDAVAPETDEVRKRRDALLVAASKSGLSGAAFANILVDYLTAKYTFGALHFPDVIYLPICLMVQHPELRNRVRQRFSRFLVDEAQDLSPLFLAMVTLSAGFPDLSPAAREHRSLMSVGDMKQSMYRWNAAMPEALDRMARYLESEVTHGHLSRCYRTVAPLVLLANAFATSFDHEHLHPSVPVVRAKPDFVRIKRFQNTDMEESWIVQEIRRLNREAGVPWGKITLLARTNRDLEKLEASLVAQRIPYVLKSDRKITKSPGYSFVNALFALAVNPRDGTAVPSLAGAIRGIGVQKVGKMQAVLFRALREFPQATVEEVLRSCLESKEYRPIFLPVIKLIEIVLPVVRENIDKVDLPDLIDMMRGALHQTIGWQDTAPRNPVLMMSLEFEKVTRVLDLTIAVHGARLAEGGDFEEMSIERQTRDVFASLALAAENAEAEKGFDDSQRVMLSTGHSYKGLENDYIFVFHLAQAKRIPDSGSDDEKCWFYVAITRQRERLYLTYADRICMGPSYEQPGIPSVHLLHFIACYRAQQARLADLLERDRHTKT